MLAGTHYLDLAIVINVNNNTTFVADKAAPLQIIDNIFPKPLANKRARRGAGGQKFQSVGKIFLAQV